MTLSTQILNFSLDIKKINKTNFDLEMIQNLNKKLNEKYKIMNELHNKFKSINADIIRLEKESILVPFNKKINININNGIIHINEDGKNEWNN